MRQEKAANSCKNSLFYPQISQIITFNSNFENTCFLAKTNTSYPLIRTCTCAYQRVRFRKFGVLCFLETPVFRFALLPYYRRIRFRAIFPFFSYFIQSRVFLSVLYLTVANLAQIEISVHCQVSSQASVISHAPALVLDYRWSQNPPTYHRTVTFNWY